MGLHARIRCFCQSAVCPQDPPGTASSEWCALTCGHIWHTKCVHRWLEEQKTNGVPEPSTCPNRCTPDRISKKDSVTGRRTAFNLVKLYFDDDVQSDTFDSSQIVDVGHEEPSSGGLRMGIGAYGQRFRPRPPKDKGKGKERARGEGDRGAAGEEDEAEEIVEEEDGDAGPRSEQELTRLRRELREAMSAARQVGGLREQIERLKQTAQQLQNDVQARDETITALEDEAKDRDEEIEQLALGQPNPKEQLEQVRDRVEVLEATEVELNDIIAELEELVNERTKERDEARNDLHETKIKAKETIVRLEDRLKSAGTEGENRIKMLQQEVESLNRVILDVRCEKDRFEIKKNQELEHRRLRAAQEVEKAQKAVEQAEMTRDRALEDAKLARDEHTRLKNGNENWSVKYDKLRHKYDKLKKRRTAISDDELGYADDDDLPLPPTVVHSPETRRIPSRVSALDSSPEPALPFKLNMNAGNLPHLATASTSTQSTALHSPMRRKRQDSAVIVISSDEEEEQSDEEEQDDLFAVDPFANGSGTWSGFGAKARLPSQSPVNKRRRVASSVPMPTLAESVGGSSTGVGVRWGPKKVELTQQRSDKHLPNFASGGVKELGPKCKVKMGAKRS